MAALSACWDLQMPPAAKAVLISLADQADADSSCWPSIPFICKRTCLGRTAVLAAVKWLEQHDAISVDRSASKSNRYSVTPDLFSGDCIDSTSPEPSAKRTVRDTDANSSPPGPKQSASRTPTVRQADPNPKEPKRTKSKKEDTSDRPDFSTWPCEPNQQLFADWLAVRRAKRAPLTLTAMRAVGRELHKASALGFDVNASLTVCVSKNWQGFEAAWLHNITRSSNYANCITGRKLGAAEQVDAAIAERDQHRDPIEAIATPARQLLAQDGGAVR